MWMSKSYLKNIYTISLAYYSVYLHVFVVVIVVIALTISCKAVFPVLINRMLLSIPCRNKNSVIFNLHRSTDKNKGEYPLLHTVSI